MNGKYERDEKTGELIGICKEEADYIFTIGIGKGKSLIPITTEKRVRRSSANGFENILKQNSVLGKH